MKHSSTTLAVGTLVLASAQVCSAQSWDWGLTSPVSPSPAGWINDYLRQDDPYMNAWNVGVFYRARYEVKMNGGFVQVPVRSRTSARTWTTTTTTCLQKVMPRIGYTAEWYEVFVQGRGSFASGDERSSSGNGTVVVDPVTGAVLASGPIGSGSSPEADSPMDLQQAYVNIGNHKEFPVSLKSRPAGVRFRRATAGRSARVEQHRPPVGRREAALAE